MVTAVAAFAAMDALGKWLVARYPVLQLLALRSTLSLALVLLAAPRLGGRRLFRSDVPGWQLVRGLCGLAAFVFFFASVRVLPLADAFAVAFGGPFIVTALSVPLLGERVDARRWLAIAAGFGGMLLVVRPTGAGFRPASVLVIGSSVAYALMMILTRWIGERRGARDETATFVLYTFGVQALVAGIVAAFDWRAMPVEDLLLGAGMGVLGLAGNYGITVAFRRAPVAVVAPFEYTSLVWAVLFGRLVFGDLPEPAVWLGVAVIVLAGLYTVRRESR